MHLVEHACDFVADLLKEYVRKKGDKKRLSSELTNGWKKSNHDESETRPEVTSEVNGFLKPSSARSCDTSPCAKKARTGDSPPEEGEIVADSMVEREVESTSKTLCQDHRSASEEKTTAPSSTGSVIENVDNMSAELPGFQTASENGADVPEAVLLTSLVPLQNGAADQDTAMQAVDQDAAMQAADQDAAMQHVAEMSPETEIDDTLMTRIIIVPQSANEGSIKDAFQQQGYRNYILSETGCDVQLKIPDSTNRRSFFDPIEVILTGDESAADFDLAQRRVENQLASTVPSDQRGRMMFNIAKANNYGACEGQPRYQRSPYDFQTWSWMAVVELPAGFEKLCGLFMDKRGKALKAIIRMSGCNHVNLSETLPKHVFLSSPNLDAVNKAISAVSDRVLWTLQEESARKKKRW